eukprot:TRINITY_DN1110_c3_g1_i1.p2 TRINITY_DN1110_c3_g1~~TRINITY_DN1110_c3_g1_i1.p2  ORF type:complete len:107 (+),score=12.42 TRINITY_DN1110_c3_g1_i1:1127-1447(+)
MIISWWGYEREFNHINIVWWLAIALFMNMFPMFWLHMALVSRNFTFGDFKYLYFANWTPPSFDRGVKENFKEIFGELSVLSFLPIKEPCVKLIDYNIDEWLKNHPK